MILSASPAGMSAYVMREYVDFPIFSSFRTVHVRRADSDTVKGKRASGAADDVCLPGHDGARISTIPFNHA
jgi:hypothetical protein